MPPRSDFGLTSAEAGRLRRLTPPWRIQKFLDDLDYDAPGEGCRSPRRVLRERKVQCMDGALFAAAALRVQGEPPLILDLEAVFDDDHVLAVYRRNGLWGSIARSNYSGLRFREPLFRSVRDLVLSYVEAYFNLRRQKTLRRYSRPFDWSRTVTLIRQASRIGRAWQGTFAVVSISSTKRPVTPPEAKRARVCPPNSEMTRATLMPPPPGS